METRRDVLGLDVRDWAFVALLVIAVAILSVAIRGGRWISVAGTVATVIGLAFALGQIRLVRRQIDTALTVAEATQRAVTTTRAQVARDELIDIIRDLKQVDRDLYREVFDHASHSGVADALASWRDGAYSVYSLIHGTGKDTDGLGELLLRSAKTAAELRDELPAQDSELRSASKSVRSDISGVCGRLGALQTTLKLPDEDLA